MKKILLFIAFLLFLINGQVAAQKFGEYQYIVFKAGINNNFAITGTKAYDNRYLMSPTGNVRLEALNQFNYTPGGQIGLQYHYDFKSDQGGIIFGLMYENYGIAASYKTIDDQYTLTERHKMHAVTIPAFVKFGVEIFDQQSYGYAGVQYNLNIALMEIQSVDWEPTRRYILPKEQMRPENFTFVLGYNYLIFNIELNYLPQNFFKTDYEVDINDNIITPFEVQPNNLIYVKSSLTLPLNDWAGSKNYKFKKFIRKVKFWN